MIAKLFAIAAVACILSQTADAQYYGYAGYYPSYAYGGNYPSYSYGYSPYYGYGYNGYAGYPSYAGYYGWGSNKGGSQEGVAQQQQNGQGPLSSALLNNQRQ